MPVLKGDLSALALILMAVWVLGSISSLTMGGFLHLFPLVAIGLMLPRIVLGRKAASP